MASIDAGAPTLTEHVSDRLWVFEQAYGAVAARTWERSPAVDEVLRVAEWLAEGFAEGFADD